MLFQRGLYLINRAVLGMKENAFICCVNVGTIGLSLLILNVFLIISLNLSVIINGWREDIRITMYLDDDLPSVETAKIKTQISSYGEVEGIRYISQDEALLLLKKSLDTEEDILKGFDTNPLPSSFEVRLRNDALTSEGVDNFVARIERINGIREVHYDSNVLEGISSFLTVFKVGNLTLAVVLSVATVFVISNIIGLSINARKEELTILKFMGATNLFVKTPFILEGFLQGLCGALFSLALVYGIYQTFMSKVGSFLSVYFPDRHLSFLPLGYTSGIILCGTLLGIFGSAVSLGKFLRSETKLR